MNFTPVKDRPFASPFFKSLGLTLCLFLTGLLFLRPYFQTADDAFFVLILKGIGFSDRPCEFLIFTNILVGLILKTLYAWIPQVAWYCLFLFSVLFLSTLAFGWILFSKVKNALFLLLMMAIFIPLFLHYYALPTYTESAFWAAQSGLLLLVFLPHPKEARALAGSLLVLSSLIRFNAFLLTLPFFLVFWIIDLHEKKGDLKGLKTFFLSVGLLVLAGYSFDLFYYRMNPAWRQAREYAEDYNRLVEYKMADYKKDQKLFESFGWSPADLDEFQEWDWLGKKFGPETVRALSQQAGYDWTAKIKSWEGLKTRFLYVQIFLFLIWAAIAIRRRSAILFLILNTLAVFSILLVLVLLMKLVPRVFYPLMFYWNLSNALSVASHRPDGPGIPQVKWAGAWGLTFILASVLVFFSFTAKIFHENHLSREKSVRFSRFLDSLPLQKDDLLVIGYGGFAIQDLPAFDPFDSFGRFQFFVLAWMQRSPLVQGTLERFHLADPLGDIVDRKDIFISFYNQDPVYQRYLKETYNLSVETNPFQVEPDYSLYRMVSKRPPNL
ncbi:MAG TPA: hypothetical protein VK859_17615 [bacterium]|nr:hypothetical protein [bacterium]